MCARHPRRTRRRATPARPLPPSPALALVAVLALVAPARAQSAPAPAPAAARAASVAPVAPAGTTLVAVSVDYIAGSSVYVTAGMDRGLMTGDTLTVLSATRDAALGRVVVLSSTASRAVVTFASRPFAVTRGVRWRLRLPARVAAGASATRAPGGARGAGHADSARAPAPGLTSGATSSAAAGAGAGSAAGEAAGPAPAALSAGGEAPSLPPRLDGRLSLDVDASRTASQWGGPGQGTTLGQTTPTLRLWAVASRLPADLRIKLNMRAAYRYATGFTFNAPQSVRFYEASVLKRFHAVPLQLELGRFYGPYGAFSGYWDGARVRLGGNALGVGAAVGYEPDLGNQGFSNRISKLSAFLDADEPVGGGHYRAMLSAHQRHVQGDSATYHFFGLTQSLSLSRLRIYQRLRVDSDPAAGGWSVTQLQLGGSVALAGPLRLNGEYDRERPAPLWTATDVFGVGRERVGGGLSAYGLVGGASVQLASVRTDGWGSGVSYAGSFDITRIPLAGIGLDGSASYWRQGTTRSIYLSSSLNREFGRARASLGYHMYRARPGGLTSMDGVQASITAPLTTSVWAMLRASQDRGAQLSTSRIYLSLWTSF